MNPNGINAPGWHNINLRDPEYQKAWARFVDKIHYFGAKCSIEFLSFMYSGWTGGKKGEGEHFFYSINGETGPDGSERPMLTREAMEAIAEDYANCAEIAMKVGFDGIFIHGGYGLVIHRFLSPLWNKRTDEFGGSFENRARFPLMIIDKIRERVGKKMVIEYRISGSELADICEFPNAENQFGMEDVVRFLNLAGDRIDIAHISAGNMSIPKAEAIMHPTIFEKSDHLGGKLVPASVASFKYDLKRFLDYQKHMIDKLMVEVKLETEATPEMIQAGEYDVVLSAVGAQAFLPPIPGIDGENVLIAEDCYGKTETLGKNIVIIGGGEIGCETALYLKEQGRNVTIIEMLPTLAPETFHLTRDIMLWRVEKEVAWHTGAACKEITENTVRFVDKDGKEQTIPCDNVIISAGMRSRNALAETFRDCAPEFRAIGDCYIAKNVRIATQTAFDAVMNL